jgi:hypothetical protein
MFAQLRMLRQVGALQKVGLEVENLYCQANGFIAYGALVDDI